MPVTTPASGEPIPAHIFWQVRLRQFILIAPALVSVALLLAGHWGWSLGVATLAGMAFCYVTLSPSTRLLGPITTHIDSPDSVVLTLDDGPDPETTPAILKLLDQADAKAVFFLIGEKARRWPELVQAIAAAGHEIGNHTEHHPAGSFWSYGFKRAREEILDCQNSIFSITKQSPRWFRAPVGHYNIFNHLILRETKIQLMGWSCRGFDTVDSSVERVLNRLKPNLQAGAIVLLHEGKPQSAALVAETLFLIQQKGLRVTTSGLR